MDQDETVNILNACISRDVSHLIMLSGLVRSYINGKATEAQMNLIRDIVFKENLKYRRNA